jgi:hypothetical protein
MAGAGADDDQRAERKEGGIRTAIGVASSLVALAAYLYLLGGFVIWLKFTAARLPTDDALGALDSNRMLAVGLKALAFELGVIGVLFLLAVLIWKRFRKPEDEREALEQANVKLLEARNATADADLARANAAAAVAASDKVAAAEEAKRKADRARAKADEAKQAEAEADEKLALPKINALKSLLHGLIVLVLVATALAKALDHFGVAFTALPLVCAGFGALVGTLWAVFGVPCLRRKLSECEGLRWWLKTGLTAAAAALAVVVLAAPAGVGVLVLLVFLHLSHLLKKLPTVREPEHLIPAALVLAGGLSLVVATYLATPPVSLDSAKILFKHRKHPIRGGYVGKSEEGVYLAGCRPSSENPRASGTTFLRVIPSDRIRRMVISDGGYVLDYGKDPSLLDLGRYLVTRDPVGEWTPTIPIDIRSSKLTCGLRHILTLGLRPRVKLTGGVRQRVKVFGQGHVKLFGPAFVSQKRGPPKTRLLSLPLRLKMEVRREHRCEGTFKRRFKVRFWPADGGKAETRRDTVTMTSAVGVNRRRQLARCHRASIHRAMQVQNHHPQTGGANAR